MLKEKMEQLGIRQALEELGYDYDEIFGGLSRSLWKSMHPTLGRKSPA